MEVRSMFDREIRLIGEAAFEKICNAKVMICGLGGVGGGVVEALVRAGVGTLFLIDNDMVDVTNLNRQLVATTEVIGLPKTQAAKKRVLDINPNINAIPIELFLTPENIPELLSNYKPDYVVDAIDNVSAKIALAVTCTSLDIPLISSMGTGNKLDPCAFRISDIYKTSVCPLARVMRRELKSRGIKSLKVLWSDEVPISPDDGEKRLPASISFVPPVAGMIIAGEVIRDIIEK